MDAANAGSADLVLLLLAAGADPNAMDDLERTPLMFAELSRVDEVIELLRARTGKYRFEEP
jgi:ankyrin repeat protein